RVLIPPPQATAARDRPAPLAPQAAADSDAAPGPTAGAGRRPPRRHQVFVTSLLWKKGTKNPSGCFGRRPERSGGSWTPPVRLLAYGTRFSPGRKRGQRGMALPGFKR